MKFLSRLLFVFMLLQSTAYATCIPSIPYNLTNGSLADATQVMGNFNTIVTDVNSNCATSGINSNITSLIGLTTPLSFLQGGTPAYIGGATTGTANAQVLAAPSPAGFSIAHGNTLIFQAGATNTGDVTLNVGGTGVVHIERQNASGDVTLSGGEIVNGNDYAVFVNTEGLYQVLNPTLITQPAGDASTNIATTGFVNGTALTLATGTTAVTQSAGDTSTDVATDHFVNTTALTLAAGTTAMTQAASDASTLVATTGNVHNNLMGANQAWTDVSGSRVLGTTYTNATGRPIQIATSIYADTTYFCYVDGVIVAKLQLTATSVGTTHEVDVIVPNGSTYQMNGATIEAWAELR